MMKRETRIYTQTVNTADSDAININEQFDDVSRMIKIGKQLIDIKTQRFGNCMKSFRRWMKQNLDKDEKSAFRYMIMANQALALEAGRIIKLSDAYHLLDLSGSIEPERVPSTYNCELNFYPANI